MQGNGLGRWNSPATNRRVFHAKQMVDRRRLQLGTRSTCTLRANDEAYAEVYLDSFSGSAQRSLRARRPGSSGPTAAEVLSRALHPLGDAAVQT